MREREGQALSLQSTEYSDVVLAAARSQGAVHRTPVVASRMLNERVGAEVHIKCENFQRAGAFKFRGVFNRLSQLSASERARGVVAASSGNHGQALALAARELGVRATIVMPSDAPAVKRDAALGYGAKVVLFDRQHDDRDAIAAQICADRGATLVPSFDDPLIIAGQGTAAKELIEDVGQLDLVLGPLGGGGLLAGTALTVAALLPSAKVVGVEPANLSKWMLSMESGHPVRIPPLDTIADGARVQSPGTLTFPIVRRYATVVTVSEAEIKEAVRFALGYLKLVIEPTGVLGLAALLSKKAGMVEGLRIGVIASGGNVDPLVLSAILAAP